MPLFRLGGRRRGSARRGSSAPSGTCVRAGGATGFANRHAIDGAWPKDGAALYCRARRRGLAPCMGGARPGPAAASWPRRAWRGVCAPRPALGRLSGAGHGAPPGDHTSGGPRAPACAPRARRRRGAPPARCAAGAAPPHALTARARFAALLDRAMSSRRGTMDENGGRAAGDSDQHSWRGGVVGSGETGGQVSRCSVFLPARDERLRPVSEEQACIHARGF